MAADRRFSITQVSAPASSGIILFFLATIGMAIVALVVLAAVWAGTESDAAALDRQRQLVNNRLLDQVQRVSHEIQLMSAGLNSLLRTYENKNQFKNPPPEFGYHEPEEPSPATTFGRIATTLFGYDAVFLVTIEGELPFDNDPAVARRFRWVRPLLQPMLEELPTADSSHAKRLSGQAKSNSSAALMRLEGRPAIAGVIPVGADHLSVGPYSVSGSHGALYLVAFRFLDGATLDVLSREQGLIGARYARAADQEQNEVAFQIEATRSHEPIGFIIWEPDLPGSRVIGRLAPVLSVAAVSFLALFLALVVRLRRSMRRLSESELYARHLALHDVLTQLPNRAMFNERLNQCLDQLSASANEIAVALIDLDRFKQVNDEHGHPAGDELLVKVVARINSVLGAGSTLARLGGDEFALLMPEFPPKAPSYLLTCEKIIQSLAQPFHLKQDNVTVSIGCSIGIVRVGGGNASKSEILRCADVALYEAKSQGRGRLIEYDQSMDVQVQLRERLRSDLQAVLGMKDDTAACAHGEANVGHLEVFYQSVHRSDDQASLTGAEALVRWQHPRHGLLTPDKFIQIAEDSGLIQPLGRWVLSAAVTAAARWAPDLTVAVNVSPSQLRCQGFDAEVATLLAEAGLASSRLEIEVTEAALLDKDEATSCNLRALRAMGVRVALDDFGTGFSSLSHLINFEVDRIKIDRSFVNLIGSKAEGAAIVSAIVDLTKTLGKTTTAEGVETEGQRDFLVAIGCTDLQGYLFSRPVPSDQFSQHTATVLPERSKA